MSGFRLIVVECHGESQHDTIVQTIREVLGTRGTNVTLVEEPAFEPEPKTEPPRPAPKQEAKRPTPVVWEPPRRREADDDDPTMSHSARVMAALRRDENLNIPELAGQCYGESTKDSIRKMRTILASLVQQRRITKVSLNRYRIVED